MPIYPFACLCGHKFERLLALPGDVSQAKCPGCGKMAKQDYQAKSPQIGEIDGPTSGYYGSKSGFPRDPSNPAKFIVPSKKAWGEYIRKKNIESIA